MNGSRFTLDRERLATLLGFDGPVDPHVRRPVADGRARRSRVARGARRRRREPVGEDVEVFSADEFGLMAIGDELCRASALMPQKRNPYALVVLRGGAGTLIGRATGVLATQRTPSGRTDNLLYAYGEVAGSVDLAARLLRLAAAVAESLRIDASARSRRCDRRPVMATDAAEALSLERGDRLPVGLPRDRRRGGRRHVRRFAALDPV